MKTKLFTLSLMMVFFVTTFAQDRTTVRANSIDISDNLDLRAVASLFGDSRDLEEFEYKLNDPNIQISNLDLNNDNQVDYLRVIESIEGNTHLIIIQSVLGNDVFQDVATVEVEKDKRNKVYVQVVGNTFLYGNNYIYEPLYVHTPVIYTNFWVHNYRPYCSSWYWGFYPSYFYAWNPFPIFRYRNNINVYINYNNSCHYVSHRRSSRAVALYNTRGRNDYGRQHPNRSFENRNQNVGNRHELTQIRETNGLVRNNSNGSVRSTNAGTRGDLASNDNQPRVSNSNSGTRSSLSSNNSSGTRSNTPRDNNTSQNYSSPRSSSSSNASSGTRSSSPRENDASQSYSSPRNYSSSNASSGTRSNSSPRISSQPRSSSSSSVRSSGSSITRSSGSSSVRSSGSSNTRSSGSSGRNSSSRGNTRG